ncbi:MAG: hypothetical protein WDN30_03745 [Pararobbsia sp.]
MNTDGQRVTAHDQQLDEKLQADHRGDKPPTRGVHGQYCGGKRQSDERTERALPVRAAWFAPNPAPDKA